MNQCNIRLPAEMIAALRAQAQSKGLDFAAHVRSQLAATLRNPHDILKPKRETASA
jgi:type IV pilus biogenesis protein CpaD/CtpE